MRRFPQRKFMIMALFDTLFNVLSTFPVYHLGCVTVCVHAPAAAAPLTVARAAAQLQRFQRAQPERAAGAHSRTRARARGGRSADAPRAPHR